MESTSALFKNAQDLKAAGLEVLHIAKRAAHRTPEARCRSGGAGRGRAARDPRRAREGTDQSGLSGPRSRGLYDTALASGTGRGCLRGRRLLHTASRGEPRAELSREN